MRLLKTCLKILGVTMVLVLLGLAALGVLAWTRPDLVVQTVRLLLPEKAQTAFSIGKVKGNPLEGYQVDKLVLNLSERPLVIDSIEFNLAWLPLIHRRTSIEYFSAHVQGSTVAVRGNAQLAPLAVDLAVTSKGLVDGEYSVKGSTQQWSVKAHADWESAQGPYRADLTAAGTGLGLAAIQAEGEAKLQFKKAPLLKLEAKVEKKEFIADLRVTDLRISKPEVDSAHFTVKGSTSSHRFSLTVRSNNERLSAGGRGELRGNAWLATWTDFHLHSYGDWRNAEPFETVFSTPSYQFRNVKLTNGSANLLFHGNLNNQSWDPFVLEVTNFNMPLLNELGFASVPLKGIATGEVSLTGPLRQPEGRISLKIKGAEADGRPIGDIDGMAALSPQFIRVENLHIRSAQGTIQLAGLIPLEKGRTKFANVDITLKATDYNPAEILKTFLDQEMQGARLNADLNIKRAAGTFTADGVLKLEAEKYAPIQQGPELHQIVLVLRGRGKSLEIEKGEAKSKKKGKINLSGSLDMGGPQVKVNADRFEFEWPTGIVGVFSTDLAWLGSWEALVFRGSVDIKSADYNPDKKRKEKSARGWRDRLKKKWVKKEKEEEKAAAPMPITVDVKIKFDRDVWFKQKQTAIEFSGDLDIRKRPNDEAQIFGKIEVIRGAYVAYGRVFDVEEGSLEFTGSVPADPLINIKALFVDKVSSIRVHLALTGPMSDPKLTLTSEPPLEEADIISVLATGKPLYQLGEGEEVDSQQVAQNMVAGYLAEGLRQELQNVVNLDVLRVQITDEQSTDIVAGKNVSRDLFISYGQTLGPSGEQRIEAEYSLTKRWSLEGRTTSLGRYVIDLLFKFGFQ